MYAVRKPSDIIPSKKEALFEKLKFQTINLTHYHSMQPRYLSFLSLMVIPGTPLAEEVRRGEFEELNSAELLKESYGITKGLELKKAVFRSDHASNYLALEGTFPKDKVALLNILESAIGGDIRLKPESLRGL